MSLRLLGRAHDVHGGVTVEEGERFERLHHTAVA